MAVIVCVGSNKQVTTSRDPMHKHCRQGCQKQGWGGLFSFQCLPNQHRHPHQVRIRAILTTAEVAYCTSTLFPYISADL